MASDDQRWRFNRPKLRTLFLLLFFLSVPQNLDFCLSPNAEAVGLMKFKERIERDPFGALLSWKGREFGHCSWLGVKCSDGKAVILNGVQSENSVNRRLLQFGPPNVDEGVQASRPSPPPPPPPPPPPESPPPPAIVNPTTPSPKPSRENVMTTPPAPSPPKRYKQQQTPPVDTSPPPLPPLPPPPPKQSSNKNKRFLLAFIIAGVVGGLFFVAVIVTAFIFFQNHKVHIKPWGGQLQKALITGVPKLKLSELRAACEDFSNIIGSFSDGTIYKGTLSSGAEIAVTSIAVRSYEDWSTELETHFKEKIDTLSKLNHKNFLNLLGYCQEDEPFARMMVFEYAPNGMLSEHLHVEEAEHLDWKMRLRIAMGIAYCLDHMHQLTPPISHKNLDSSSVFLTEDNAAKIVDFMFLNHITPAKEGSSSRELLEFPLADLPSNVYSFGAILYEIMTATTLHSDVYDFLVDSLSPYLQGNKLVREIVDPNLESYEEDVLERLLQVVQHCAHPDPIQRPTMREVVVKLREITGIGTDGAMPRLSPSWWAELEIISTEGY